MMVGLVLFLLIFLLIAPATRAAIDSHLGAAGAWVTHAAPFSYILIGLILLAGFVSIVILARWPPIPEPEDPLAEYRNRDDVLVD